MLATALCLFANPANAGGKAQISVGSKAIPGVTATAMSYRAKPSGFAEVMRQTGSSSALVLQVQATESAPTNRCTATNVGGSFTYTFGSGVECASFAAPSPDGPTARQPKRPRPPSPEEIAAALFDRTVALAPDPAIEVAPGILGLTGLPSFVWLDRPLEPLTATASAGPVTVIAEAHPAGYSWHFGDGASRTTAHPGQRWTPRHRGSIAHTYETAGRYDLSIDVLWQARWRTGSGPWRPLGTFSTSDSRPYAVREVLAWLVPWR